MNVKDFGQLIEKMRSEKGLSQRELGRLINVSHTYISKIEKGVSEPPSDEIISSLSVGLGVPADELFLFAGRLSPKTRELIKKGEMPPEFANYVQSLGRATRKNEPVLKVSVQNNFIEIPILGSISAGLPVFAEENIIGYEKTPIEDVNDGEYFYLNVQGDSMTGSRIFDGDRVLVKVTTDIAPRDICVVIINDQDATLKRVNRTNGHVILMPDNPKYEPIVIDKGQVRIIGKVVKVEFKP